MLQRGACDATGWRATLVALALLAPGAAAAPPAPATRPAGAEPLPSGALGRFGQALLHHGGYVQALAFSPDGSVLASGGGGPYNQKVAVNLWDTATGALQRELAGGRYGTMSIRFTGDGKVIASLGQDQTLHFWDVRTGAAATGFASGRVRCQWMDLAPDGKTVVVSEGGTLKLLDTRSGQAKATLGRGNWGVFSADGNSVLVVSAYDPKGGSGIFSAANGRLVRKCDTGQRHLSVPAFSPDGKLFAAGCMGGPDAGNVLVWDAATGKIAHKLPGTAGYLRAVSFAADGKRIAVAAQSGVVSIYELGKAKPVAELQAGSQAVQQVALSPDGRFLAAGGSSGQIRLWDAVTLTEKLTDSGHRADVRAVALSPDGRYVLTGGDDGTARLWKADGTELCRLAAYEQPVTAAAFGQDANGALLAAAATKGDTVAVFEVPSGRPVRSLTGGEGGGAFVRFLPGGAALACVGTGGGFSRIDLRTGKTDQAAKQAAKTVTSTIAVTPDGRLAAGGGGPQVVTVWDTRDGRQRGVFGVQGAYQTFGLALDPFGQLLACDAGQKLAVFEVDSGRTCREITIANRRQGFSTLAFSPDGAVLAVGQFDGDILLFSALSGESLGQREGHRGRVTALAFSPDGRRLLSGSADTTALLWSLDGTKRPGPARTKLDEATFNRLWGELAAGEPARGVGATLALAAGGEPAAAMLAGRLESAKGPRRDDVQKLIDGLGDAQFAARQRAFGEMAKLGVLVEPALRRALRDSPNEEVRARAEQLLAAMDDPSKRTGEVIRQIRAVHALQRIGTAKALGVLEDLARGAPGANLTERAREAAEALRATDAPPGRPRPASPGGRSRRTSGG